MKIATSAAAVLLSAILGAASAFAADPAGPSFTAEQAKRGGETYQASCSECHGPGLNDGQFASPLKGQLFKERWGGKALSEPFDIMATMMPPSNPGGLGAGAYADVLAYILQQNGAAPADKPLPSSADALKGFAIPR